MSGAVTQGHVTVAANLVPYLRRGIKRELSATLVLLAFQIDATLDRPTYHNALARFDEARALFDVVGVSDDPQQRDLELDLCRWPRLVLRVLESEYDVEVMRLQDRAAEGFELSVRELPALGSLVSDVRKKVGAPPRRSSKESIRQLSRRIRRSRGSG
jgi:hypothetical protein